MPALLSPAFLSILRFELRGRFQQVSTWVIFFAFIVCIQLVLVRLRRRSWSY